jgi:hypothetical protein
MKSFTAYLEWDQEINLSVGFVPGIPEVPTQGDRFERIAVGSELFTRNVLLFTSIVRGEF